MAQDLLNRLHKLKDNGKGKRWATVRQVPLAIQTIWNQQEIKEIEDRLNTYRQEILLQMHGLLNENLQNISTHQKHGFRSLEDKGDDIKEGISKNLKLTSQNQLHHEETHRQLGRIAAAILSHHDGRTSTILPYANSGKPDIAQHTGTSDGDVKQNFMAIYEFDRRNAQDAASCVSMHNAQQILHRVLDFLSFRKIRDREDGVALAHQDTLEWVFQDPKPLKKPWDSFMQWLETGEGCYWINGKAGSGKSTLMKHVCNDRRTHDALSVWAGNQSLTVASFFFYNLGSTPQKSQEGLLRSLLHDILEQNPELSPQLVPTLCVAASKGENLEPSFRELMRAFENLKQILSSSTSYKMCLFIDGIDELEGDHTGLSNFFAAAAACSPNIKLVISSRPIPVCVDVFGDFPGLRLQDLTFNDIRSYTNDMVRKNKRWPEIAGDDDLCQLINEIVEKSSGVFLWVVLAVASLLDGLRNYDRVADLRKRLETLPPDLENLYSHMLDKLEPLYQTQASQLLQIVYQHVDLADGLYLSTLQLSFAAEENPRYAVESRVEPLPIAQKVSRCKATEGRVRSRCCGLIEIWQSLDLPEEESIITSHVSFLHRTVVEFLRNSEVWSHITSFTKFSSFDPNVALASGFLLEIKTMSLNMNTGHIYFEVIRESMRRCLSFCCVAETTTLRSQTEIVDELDRAMSLQWNVLRELLSHEPAWDDYLKIPHWSFVELNMLKLPMDVNLVEPQSATFVFAATKGLPLYIQEKLAASSHHVQQALTLAVVPACPLSTRSEFAECKISSSINSQSGEVIRQILGLGVNPNLIASYCPSSAWVVAAEVTAEVITSLPFGFDPEAQFLVWTKTLKLFLDHGADPTVKVRNTGSDGQLVPVSSIISQYRAFLLSWGFQPIVAALKKPLEELQVSLTEREKDIKRKWHRKIPKLSLTTSEGTRYFSMNANDNNVPDGCEEKRKPWFGSLRRKSSQRLRSSFGSGRGE